MLRATEDAEMGRGIAGHLGVERNDVVDMNLDDFDDLIESANTNYASDLAYRFQQNHEAPGSAIPRGDPAGEGVKGTTGNGGIGTHLPETVSNPPIPSPAQPAAPPPSSTGTINRESPLYMRVVNNDVRGSANPYKIYFPNGNYVDKPLHKESMYGYTIHYRTADEYFKATNYAKNNPKGSIVNSFYTDSRNDEL